MKISGKEIAQRLLEDLKRDIQQNNLHPSLAIILAGSDPSSEIYVANKIKAASDIGIDANLYRFSQDQNQACLERIKQLNSDPKVNGIIVQYPIFEGWNFDEISSKVDPQKDVDGFVPGSPFFGATALGVWEMLKEFANIEGFLSAEEFLKGKKIVILGKGRAAGGPTIKLLRSKGFKPTIVDTKTENPQEEIKSGDVVISATGRKHIINGSNIKDETYVIGVGVGKGDDGKTFGDINQKEVGEKAKLYCPTIGGIGPLTVACLLKNVVESAKKAE